MKIQVAPYWNPMDIPYLSKGMPCGIIDWLVGCERLIHQTRGVHLTPAGGIQPGYSWMNRLFSSKMYSVGPKSPA